MTSDPVREGTFTVNYMTANATFLSWIVSYNML